MALAVSSLSPVIIAVLIPMASSSFTAETASSLRESATAIIPIILSSEAKTKGVLPSFPSSAIFSSGIFPLQTDEMKDSFPAKILFPFTIAETPLPVTFSNPTASGTILPSVFFKTA